MSLFYILIFGIVSIETLNQVIKWMKVLCKIFNAYCTLLTWSTFRYMPSFNEFKTWPWTSLKLTWKVINHWRRQPCIFFLVNLFLKHGINSVYVMVDFICKGQLEVWRMRVEWELQNEKVLPTVGFEPGTFRLRSECAAIEPRDWCQSSGLKFTWFYLCYF